MPHPVFIPPTTTFEFDPDGDPRRPWVVAKDQKYVGGWFEVTVPAGFRTDLASVPRWALWLVDPLGRHQRAAVFHDYAYASQFCTRFEADSIFRAILEADGVAPIRTYALYYAVRLFGGTAWSDNANATRRRNLTARAKK